MLATRHRHSSVRPPWPSKPSSRAETRIRTSPGSWNSYPKTARPLYPQQEAREVNQNLNLRLSWALVCSVVLTAPVLNPSPDSDEPVSMSSMFSSQSQGSGLNVLFVWDKQEDSRKPYMGKLTVSMLCPKEGRRSCVPAVHGDSEPEHPVIPVVLWRGRTSDLALQIISFPGLQRCPLLLGSGDVDF